MKVGILGGGPSASNNIKAMHECERVVTMNASLDLFPMADAYCVADPSFISQNREMIEGYANSLREHIIFQGIVTDHPDGYASQALNLGEQHVCYGMADAMYHGRTIGVLACRMAIQHFGATELVIAGIDGYPDSSFGRDWSRKLNEHSGKALALLKAMHPSVQWTWLPGAGEIIKPIIDDWETVYKTAMEL